MKIALCGRPGSGKSTVAKALAEKFNLKHYSGGDLMRQIATNIGYKIEDYAKVTPEEIDHFVDEKTKKIASTEDNFIIDSRLGFHFVPDAMKIFLDVTYKAGADRIFKHQRESEGKISTVAELAKRNKARWDADRKRYLKIYKVDINDKKKYDIYIDTTKKNVAEVITEIERAIRALRKT